MKPPDFKSFSGNCLEEDVVVRERGKAQIEKVNSGLKRTRSASRSTDAAPSNLKNHTKGKKKKQNEETDLRQLRSNRPLHVPLHRRGSAKASLVPAGAPELEPAEQVGGARHCGGNFVLPNCVIADPAIGHLVPELLMGPGAVVIFPGNKLVHGTSLHHCKRRRGCEAHVSFAIQTERQLLGEQNTPQVQAQLATLCMADIADTFADAVWIPVWKFPEAGCPGCRLSTGDPKVTAALGWRRIVLYDADVGMEKPLVAYDADGGLVRADLAEARRRFNFLHDEHKFGLDRGSKHGDLALDARGDQRMEMLGIHELGRNHQGWAGELTANDDGDIDAYAIHFKKPNLFGGMGGDNVWLAQLFDGAAERMHKHLPRASKRLEEVLLAARVRERLRSDVGACVTSEHLLVNNVGVSSAYASPSHLDVSDCGYMTFAMSIKCDAS